MSADLDLVEAKWRLHLLAPSSLHEVAGRLLDEGLDVDSLIDLFAIPVDTLDWEGPPAFERFLIDAGRGRMTESEAVQTVARDLGGGLISGRRTSSETTKLAASLYFDTDCRFDVFLHLFVLDEEMSYIDEDGKSYLNRTRDEVERDVQREARRLVARGDT